MRSIYAIDQGKEKERNSDGVPAIFVTFFFMYLSAVRSYPSHFPASAFSASILPRIFGLDGIWITAVVTQFILNIVAFGMFASHERQMKRMEAEKAFAGK